MKIPKIFHRVWIGKLNIPEKYQVFWNKWKELHPQWIFYDWRDEELKKLSLYPLIKLVKCPASAADIARYEIVYNYGGVYVDCDFDCKQPIDKLLEDESFIICNQIPDLKCFCSNGFFASTPKNSILARAIQDLKETDIQTINNSDTVDITGPYFFRRIINNHKVKVLDTNTLYSYMHLKKDEFLCDASLIYGIHDWGGTSLSEESLLFLAKKQFKNGDYESCIKSCEKITNRYENSLAKRLYKKAEKSIINRKFFFDFVLNNFLILFSLLLTKIEIYRNNKIIKKIKLFNKNDALTLLKKTEKNSKITKKILIRYIKKILNKSLQITIAKIQYNHLLDYLFQKNQFKTIIELGAMDGKSFDKIYPYLKTSNNNTALFVEPLEDNFKNLLENYKGFENKGNKFYFEKVAITDISGKFTITRIPDEVVKSKNFPDWTRGVSSLVPEKNILSSSIPQCPEYKTLKELAVQETVDGITFKSLLEKYSIDKIDILQIDTEGYDFIILKQVIAIRQPKLICFEWVNLSSEEKKDALRLLLKYKYLMFPTLNNEDMIACQYSLYSKFAQFIYSHYSVIAFPYFKLSHTL